MSTKISLQSQVFALHMKIVSFSKFLNFINEDAIKTSKQTNQEFQIK